MIPKLEGEKNVAPAALSGRKDADLPCECRLESDDREAARETREREGDRWEEESRALDRNPGCVTEA